MRLQKIKNATAAVGIKLLLTTASPLQSLLDTPGITHDFINRQALSILRQDGFVRCADFLTLYLPELTAGVFWADDGWKNIHHYFNPVTRKGLWKFNTALNDYAAYLSAANTCSLQHDWRRSIFFLGAAAHLLQDLCVPHHASGRLFSGHKEYESWSSLHHRQYAVSHQGLYHLPIDRLMIHNAEIAADLLSWVSEHSTTTYDAASRIALPLAQRSTAGLFLRFFTALPLAKQARTPSIHSFDLISGFEPFSPYGQERSVTAAN
ncbi:MAG TPA: zinc dependent phospholipase C family protein [Patescibacteria group bacterium]|nr:zinc dependent phospholipase C family protein [Patescibacteria group bacterium]